MEEVVNQAKLFKVLSDPGRLKIIEILSCGELCACEIQAFFAFSQPTLSHHMKVLMDSGLVTCRKEGLWSHYALNTAKAQGLIGYLTQLVADTEVCLCKQMPAADILLKKSALKEQLDVTIEKLE